MTEVFPRILACGDKALSVEFADRIDEGVNASVIALAEDLCADAIEGVTEVVPTYRSLMVTYDPLLARGRVLAAEIERRLASISAVVPEGCLFDVPVVYGGGAGLDFEELAALKGLTSDELIALHASVEYRVYMIGFAPGFAYLGGLPQALHTPRLATPRQRVEAGSIGIGGQQASINSLAGPSGWRYIGRTPLRLFDPARAAPCLLRAGDRIRFRAIDAAEARAIDGSPEQSKRESWLS
ncbi:5-oxoprolinase subunit PxpB [Oryzibacter oryziterrae]|uniref:5-oxoprolinase subunit PxpB n=1 Tax=Oryzibacter oryziterrae TaxID=2766474 RepID=UPI001F2C7BF8|nr:5-oxoprolinase subunit PxpB [Oryzibacter oryziterrae]